ncbi:PEP/pyruvate-binding domain-containing protein [Micromonospora sp. WMMD714]|uniref:PEP/pyruvate-binding domain-containing protein n=1 Tax=Micromonospora sp. WMMD714 TaxID=3016097 RepID=UPI00249A6840|nr:PEP/pyruvate-binding domain-containing protein [Micromonospora sp. WMMD714]WFE65250.1 PEP/pyruvate-binding domain-containing protein [Micromonospora sp. WMMD714]
MQSYCKEEAQVSVLPLSEAHAGLVPLVGGKAAGLGELIRAGERVPDGFCVTTEAYRAGVVPQDEVRAAYARLGGGPVAVRSSATDEDLPDASFAGQHDTVLDVEGEADLVAAIDTCWKSLHGDRAVAYREAHGTDPADARMAVVVQRMVTPVRAGVLYTANPVTGNRTEMLVDVGTGLGTRVVDGHTDANHLVLTGADHPEDGPAGAAGARRGAAPGPGWHDDLWTAGRRIQAHFGVPQDVEWAIDHDGTLWLLQSRPVTTLFPLPPQTDDLRVYVEFGNVQGMLRPVTPMGMSTLSRMIAAMVASLGMRVEIVDIGGRLYGDLTDLVRRPAARKRLVRLMAVDFGPRAQAVMEHVLRDPRFAPSGDRSRRPADASLGTALRALRGILRALARPDAARDRLLAAVDRLRAESTAPPQAHTAHERLRFVRDHGEDTDDVADDVTWPIVAGMLASALPAQLLKGVATEADVHAVLRGVPHNVTIEMDLALWALASAARPHRDLLLDTPPAELAARYLRGALPEIGLAAFLSRYGHRAAAEADVGVPRWAEDPTPVFAAIANYLRLTDPAQAPDRRFAEAAGAAEAALNELAARAVRQRPVRGRIAVFLLRRARRLAGLRESGKFAGLYRLQAVREQLLLIGSTLFPVADDVMFLTLDEVETALGGTDLSGLVARRRATHRRELRRRVVPVAILSDGTDVESTLPATDDGEGLLRGVGAATGKVTGPARVVTDPATAYLEPGEILVTATTDPGWTPLFLTAAALVTETGAVMAHGPTVAREYGIPAVISVPGATSRIVTGQVITVDGAAGTVTTRR